MNSGSPTCDRVYPNTLKIITDPDVLLAYSVDALGIKGRFEGLLRPEGEQEVVEAIRYAFRDGIPITPQGLRTSLTGASMGDAGIALSLERMKGFLDLDIKRQMAVVEPGLVTAELRAKVMDCGLSYAPDPTSQGESTIGGNVATNASGSRTLKYGSTGDYVEYLRVVDGTGEIHELWANHPPKRAYGPRAFQLPTGLFVGSEGILGVITRLGLRLMRPPLETFLMVAYFEELFNAIDFVLDSLLKKRMSPASMEFLDHTCIALMRGQEGFYAPEGASAIVYLEEDLFEDGHKEGILSSWLELLRLHTRFAEETMLLQSPREIERFHGLRHRIPEVLNEASVKATRDGGIKVSTDWVVPLQELRSMFRYFEAVRPQLKDMLIASYGHIGSGHPHINIIARDPQERVLAEEVAWKLIKKAVELGGGVSGEHGIGKLKKRHLKLMYPECVQRAMRAVKRELDPKGILAPGNLL